MDSATLVAELDDYRNQLKEIEMLLLAGGESAAELEMLKTELEEIIGLTEEKLLDARKKELLEKYADETPQSSGTDDRAANGDSTVDDSILEESSGDDDIVGTPLRLLCRHADNEPAMYHNCVVLQLEEEDSLRILFSNPLLESMRTCDYFLNGDGACRFGEERCRNSHGVVVGLDEVDEYVEPDFAALKEDDYCLCRVEEDSQLWELCRIVQISREENRVAVKQLKSAREVAVPFDRIVPAEVQTAEEDEEEDVDISNSSPIAVEESGCDVTVSTTPQAVAGDFGSWEQHTKGIGSKLMARMGYVIGEGLGSQAQGRVDPVEARIVPKGKSLDAIMNRKRAHPDGEKVVSKSATRRKLRRLRAAAKAREDAYAKPTKDNEVDSLFGFLNRKTTARHDRENDEGTAKTREQHQAKKAKECSDKSINIKLLKLQDSLKNVRRELASLQKTVTRNSNPMTRAKFDSVKQKLAALESEEQRYLREQHNRREKQKLKNF